MKYLNFLLVSVVFIFSGCVEKSNDDYVGHWVNLKDPKNTIEIKKNGDGFILERTLMKSGYEVKENPMSAEIKNGALVSSDGFYTVSIDKNNGELIASSYGRYKK
jgi:hypothetical protein